MQKILMLWLCLLAIPLFAQKVDMEKLAALKPRAIGPAGMSGRVTAIDAVYAQPSTMYVGTASGGLWKSDNGGTDWKPLFDKEKVLSIGAVKIDQNNPNIVWVGTGEGNPRNSQNMGAGIYKSIDGGRSWQLMGLEKSRTIHRIYIHPSNSDIVYVGVQGSAWGDGTERGVFKTTDGGKTWRKVLYVNERTGVGEMVIDPTNPNKLLVNMWEFRRQPWVFKSGGASSGLYLSTDGGEQWKRLSDKDGLPEGDLGRMGLAIAASNPNIVYALIENKKNGIYKSEDGGFTWKKVTDQGQFGDRPFYYAEIYCDPKNENRLYSLFSLVSMSEDAGRTWRVIMPYYGAKAIHPDHHAWWIHPHNPNFLINGNDGGMAISYDMGKTWRFVENLPVSQYYHINVDNATPYNVYGGMQDNGSWKTPAYVWQYGGIRNSETTELSFGDGFDVVPDPTNPRYGYSMSQGGALVRYDLETGNTKYLKPVHPQGKNLRFNWNAGIALDPLEPRTVYYGSQFLHKSTDRGENWSIISPDLTTNNPDKLKAGESGGLTFDVTGAENHCTILAIAPSPKQQGVIWVGTDDGQLHLTQDGGKTWQNLSSKLVGVPANSWIPQIHVSSHQAGEAFVVVNNYRREDWTPYLYHTKDFGKTWTRLVDDSKVRGWCLAVVQDPIEPKLLFLGTEFGLYVSIDYGQTWTHWTNNYPHAVPTIDMVIHPREHDLVIGTFGRAAYILDDIRPLRELAQKGYNTVMDKAIHAFAAPDAILANYRTPMGMRFPGNTYFQGDNRPQGAMLSFAVKEVKFKKAPDTNTEAGSSPSKDTPKAAANANTTKDTLKVTIEILDAQRKVIRTLRLTPKPGINRLQWNLDHKGVARPGTPEPRPDAPEPGGIQVLPGTYTIRYTYEGAKDSTTVRVLPDPREQIAEAERQASFALAMQLERKMEKISQAVKQLNDAKAIAENVSKELKGDDDAAKNLKKQTQAALDSIKAMRELVLGKEGLQGIFRDSDILSAKMGEVRNYIDSSNEAPNGNTQIIYAQVNGEASKFLERVNKFFENDWAKFQKAVEDSKFSLFKKFEPIKTE